MLNWWWSRRGRNVNAKGLGVGERLTPRPLRIHPDRGVAPARFSFGLLIATVVDEWGHGCPGSADRLACRVANKVEDDRSAHESHLCLGRMDVDVHLVRGKLDEEHCGRIRSRWHHRPIGFRKCARDHLVAHIASIDEEILVVTIGARGRGRRNEAPDNHPATLEKDLDQITNEIPTE